MVPSVLQRAPEAATLRGPDLNAEVDRRFWERTHYRVGERLRKDRPEDAPHIREWLTIRDEVRAERQGKGHPSNEPKHAAASPLPAPGLESVQNEGSGRWLLRFQGYTEVGAVAGYLWPRGAPEGVEITPTVVVTEPVQMGEFELTHVTQNAIMSMEPWIGKRFVEEGLFYELPPSTTEPAARTGTHGPPYPDIDIENESQLEKWIEKQLEIIHWTAHVYEIVGYATHAIKNIAYGRAVAKFGVDAVEGVGEVAAEAAEVEALENATILAETIESISAVAGPIGGIALIVWVGIQVITAFRAEKKEAAKLGVAYGTMWASLREPQHIPKFGPGLNYSAEELREAFMEGVKEGQDKVELFVGGLDDPAKDVGSKIRHYVFLSVIKGGGDVWAVASELLWDMMNNAQEGPRKPYSFLGWPTPNDIDPFALWLR
jgi:hypothetical protein